jgi:hypothetical protein
MKKLTEYFYTYAELLAINEAAYAADCLAKGCPTADPKRTSKYLFSMVQAEDLSWEMRVPDEQASLLPDEITSDLEECPIVEPEPPLESL